MKKQFWAVLLCAALVVGAGVFWTARAQQSGSFQITITVGYISIGLYDYANASYSTWAIGSVSTGTLITMESNAGSSPEKGILVSNESNVAIDLASYATNANGWTLVSGVPAADQYRLRATSEASWQSSPYPAMGSAVAVMMTVAPGTDIQTGISGGANRYWYYDLYAPSSVSGGAGNTITVTVEASGS